VKGLTIRQTAILLFFRRTGRYVGKDALWKDRWPRKDFTNAELLALRKKGLLEHSAANRWYLTEAGREQVML
jgi:hypothetical protein